MNPEEEKFSEELPNKSNATSIMILDAENGDVYVTENKTNGEFLQEKDQQKEDNSIAEDIPWSTRMWEVFTTFWPLGFVAFGGPQAHIAILRDHLVIQRDWMDEETFTGEIAIVVTSFLLCKCVVNNRWRQKRCGIYFISFLDALRKKEEREQRDDFNVRV